MSEGSSVSSVLRSGGILKVIPKFGSSLWDFFQEHSLGVPSVILKLLKKILLKHFNDFFFQRFFQLFVLYFSLTVSGIFSEIPSEILKFLQKFPFDFLKKIHLRFFNELLPGSLIILLLGFVLKILVELLQWYHPVFFFSRCSFWILGRSTGRIHEGSTGRSPGEILKNKT